jgi:signal transduction histidine kinase
VRGSGWLPVGVGLVSGLLLLGATWMVGPMVALPPAIGVGSVAGILAGQPGSRRWLGAASVVAAAASLTATALSAQPPSAGIGDAVPYAGSAAAGLLGLVEAAMLLVLLALVVRRLSWRLVAGVGGLLVLADLAWLLRLPAPPSVAAGLGVLLVWCAGPLVAGTAGGYPRLAEARRRRSVVDAERDQRLRLARDLHDFVAHDVTGIVVQAQAARHVGRDDPAVAVEALRRIEAAGQHALASIDQALNLLREGEHALDRPAAVSTQDLTALLEGFAVAGGPTIGTRIDEHAWQGLTPELAALGHRVLAEALTNIRRHAPTTDQVNVTVTAEGHDVAISVTNRLPPARSDRSPRGGRGIPQLAALVADAGGELSAGPSGEYWRLHLSLPALRGAEQ